MAVHFIVDDQSPELKYLCPVTKETVSGAYLNKTWTTTASDQCLEGWFQYTFYGTGVEVVIFSSSLQNHSAKLDDSSWITQYNRGSFQSPLVPDEQHTLVYAPGSLDTPTFDYLIVEAGPSTPLQNQTIVVDDTDPGLIYGGNWSTQIPFPMPRDLSTAFFRDTTHWSKNAGDTLEFNFSGSSVAIFGAFVNISVGHDFSATYTVDGISTVASIPDGTLDGLPMNCLFSTSTMPAGNHTLSVQITQISPPLFVGFDFLMYNASFANLEEIPGYVSSSSSLEQRKYLAGTLAGGVIGGVGFIFAVLVFIIILRRRNRGAGRPNVMGQKNRICLVYYPSLVCPVVRPDVGLQSFIKFPRRTLATSAENTPPADPVEYCQDLVRKHDYEGFLMSHFYPGPSKGGYFALKAFSVELAMVQEHVSNQTIGKMRIQFWRDAVKGIHEGKPPRHPIALALHQASQRVNLPAYHLKRIVDARDAELSTPTHITMESITAHAESTSSPLLYLLLSLLSIPSSALSHAASHLGTAQTFTTLLRALPYHVKQGHVIIPAEITAKHGVIQEDVLRYGPGAEGISDAVFEFATAANDHLITAREMLKEEGMGSKVPARAVPIFLAGIPVAHYLARLEKVNFDAFAPSLQLRDWKLPWQIWRGYYKRQF
ncbi:UPF0551 protein, mitochondrial [Termitomyces sp. J132]|nr:UPF0551 protein, mitochondrial [Termitomyces sp. J132]